MNKREKFGEEKPAGRGGKWQCLWSSFKDRELWISEGNPRTTQALSKSEMPPPQGPELRAPCALSVFPQGLKAPVQVEATGGATHLLSASPLHHQCFW